MAELSESSRKEYYFVPLEAFRSSQDVSSRTCIPFSDSTTGQKTRPGVVCQCPTTWGWLSPFMALFLPDVKMHAFSWSPVKVTFQDQDNHNHSLCFPGWILSVILRDPCP